MNAGRLGLLLVVLVIAIGAIIFRDRLSGNAGELEVGDCFDIPTGETIKDVQHHPCTEAHGGEVLFVGKYADQATLPTEDQFNQWVVDNCIGQTFTSYVGATYEAREDIGVGAFWPTSDGWSGGDREVTCYLAPANGGTVTTSYRVAASPAAS